MPKIVYTSLKDYLVKEKIRETELAALIPCDQSYVSKLVNNNSNPSFRMARRIEQVTCGAVPRTIWYPNE